MCISITIPYHSPTGPLLSSNSSPPVLCLFFFFIGLEQVSIAAMCSSLHDPSHIQKTVFNRILLTPLLPSSNIELFSMMFSRLWRGRQEVPFMAVIYSQNFVSLTAHFMPPSSKSRPCLITRLSSLSDLILINLLLRHFSQLNFMKGRVTKFIYAFQN